MYQFGKSSLKKLEKLHPKLQELALFSVKYSPFDFGLSWTYRSPEKQNKLYQQGRTLPGDIITNCDGIKSKSKHNYLPALAFDFFVIIDGKVTWDEQYYKAVGAHIKETAKILCIKIKWPIELSKGRFDWPHIQLNES
jgi:peptidoglycan L-alanyl-D-glutamate endopeptidase CwlK